MFNITTRAKNIIVFFLPHKNSNSNLIEQL